MIRPWRFIGGGANLVVTLNGAEMYGIAVNEHVVLRVPPGEQIVGVTGRGWGANEHTGRVEAQAGRRYYYRIETGTPFSPEFYI